jgi:single-stranded DNA-specific DHH superfamily exonuclease
MIGRLQIAIDPIINDAGEVDYDMDVREVNYSRRIKLLINALINEAKKWNEDFKKIMQSIFTFPVPNSNEETRMLDEAKISMKFREDIEVYIEAELNDPGIPIKSPEVLRVIVKWIEELEALIKNP